MLTLKKVTAGYDGMKIVHNIDLTVNKGEIVALIGPNGAGKSTILKSIYQMTDNAKGKITFKDKDISNTTTNKIMESGIAFVNQGNVIFEDLSIKENLCIIHNNPKTLKFVYSTFPDLKKYEQKNARALSGGQRQQLAIGRALMQEPELILMDEPTLGLSPILQQELFKTIKELSEKGISFLIVEQNAKLAILHSHQTYLLEVGKIVLHGGKEILDNPQIKEIYLG